MRPRTALAVVVVLAVLSGTLVYGYETVTTHGGSLDEQWVSDTAVSVTGNHHAVAAGRVGNRSLVFAPVSGKHDTTDCRLVALDGTDGSAIWKHQVPPKDCWIHSVATLTLADYNGDGTPDVIAPTTEDKVYAFAPRTGKTELVHPLAAYGYSEAVVGHLTNQSARQIAVVDAKGTVFVITPSDSAVWKHHVGSYVWATPAIADFTADPGNELAVGFGKGFVTVYRSNGTVAWNTSAPFDGSLTWMTTGDATGDGKADVVAATDAGQVVALDGRNGHVLWKHDFGTYAAVNAFGDGNGDGTPEVYATAQDGKLRAIDAANGHVEWTTALTTGKVQMTPPPVMGDVTGDGHPELVAVTNDGTVSVVDPASGNVLASYSRNVPIWEHATVAGANGDGADEIYVMYGDGRVAALTYRANGG